MQSSLPRARTGQRNPDPDRWSTGDQAAGLFLLGLIYSLLLGWLALGLAGGGHGAGFFLAVSIPGVVLWPAAGAAIAFGHHSIGRWVGPAILFTQYALGLDTMALIDRADRADVAMVCERAPGLILAFTALFLTGQGALWFVYVAKRRNARAGMSRRQITLGGVMMAMLVVSLLLAMVVIPARWVFGK